jgi:hypothetical protein
VIEMSPLEWLWTIAVLGVWLVVGAVHLLSLRWGAIMGITSGRHAILRKNQPIKFWLTWFILAWPFVILPALGAAGLILGFPE